MTKQSTSFLAILLMAFALAGCGIYSFSGAAIPSHLNTISIPQVQDRSSNTLTNLDDTMTNLLMDRFVQQTRLSLEPSANRADALLRVQIDRYSTQPTSVSGQEQATLNRVTITVSVTYTDQTNDTAVLDRSFSSFEEYDPLDPNTGLTGEDAAATAVLEKIADDIFTAATSNW